MTFPHTAAVFSCLFLALGCSTTASEPESGQLPAPTVHVQAATSASVVPGYVHRLAVSRFKIGQAVGLEVDTATLQRWRGSYGAFALDPTNGWTMAVLNADSPTGPYILDDAVQGAQVKAYFVGAGLPQDQVGAVKATYEVGGGGLMTPPNTSQAPVLHAINTFLSRSINGIEIMESYAVARMTTTGDVDWESVFWPAIDTAVVNSAVAFAASLTGSDAHAQYLAKLPGPVIHDKGVVIHHTTSGHHGQVSAFVSYDAKVDTESSSGDRHFDVNGVEFQLPQEQPTAHPRAPPR